MYFIELIVKKILSRRRGYIKPQEFETDETRCEHVFMPIDSTGEILACSKCGVIVHKKDLKKYKKQG